MRKKKLEIQVNKMLSVEKIENNGDKKEYY